MLKLLTFSQNSARQETFDIYYKKNIVNYNFLMEKYSL